MKDVVALIRKTSASCFSRLSSARSEHRGKQLLWESADRLPSSLHNTPDPESVQSRVDASEKEEGEQFSKIFWLRDTESQDKEKNFSC